MDGKVVVITGPTAGIGKAAAIELARRGAELGLVSRNPAKAEAVAGEIRAGAPGVVLHQFTADLSELDQVRAVAGAIAKELDRIDVLVDNAGTAARRPRRTVDGFDEMLAANYLGPFLLTHLLLDRLEASAPARVVVVGSEAHRATGRFDAERFEDLGDYGGLVPAQAAYGQTKLLDMLFADELARRLDGSGVTVNSLCPGLVATDLAGDVGAADAFFKALSATPLVRTPEQGARMTVRLAGDPALAAVTGRFFSSTPGAGLLPTAGPRRDPAIARRVYERTCALVGIDGR